MSDSPTTWSIVYHPDYNISFMGMEKLHVFDAGKWGNVYRFLIEAGLFKQNQTFTPTEPTVAQLLKVHSQEYLDSLKWSFTVARITEIAPVALIPNFIVQRKVLRPLRLQTGGSILAGTLAMRNNWSIHIGGGFHHCCATQGGGFCAYADISLLIKKVFDDFVDVKKVMIVDLDAHQGNGHARDFMGDSSVYILDVYNRSIYPQDGYAKRGISRKVELQSGVGDEEYLSLVKKHLHESLSKFEPHLIVYNAGTDILAGDPLGHLNISPEGIIKRDELVFSAARSRGIPIVMLTSGGYQRSNARIIADSILNLRRKSFIGSKIQV